MMNTTMATTTTTAMAAAVVTGCIAATFTNADAVIANAAAVTALKAALAGLIQGVTADMITERSSRVEWIFFLESDGK